MFLDETKIQITSGKGGDGISSFRREAMVPKGGPDGGDGGHGGSVYLRVNEQYTTLLDMGNIRMFKAKNGQSGGAQKCTGKSGEDLYIDVPRGTLIKDEQGMQLADLTEIGETWLAAPGGKGGLGNQHFATPTNRAPRKFTVGKPAVERILHLELKLMADVGLVGFPNAGKSSLVNKISGAKPKVADYPFTTLNPILGIVQSSPIHSFVIADIPGIIEGAAKGKGLGHTFLKHIERNHTLLYVIDGFSDNPWEQFEILQKELKNFHPQLAKKPFIVALNKADLGIENAEKTFKQHKQDFVSISAATGKGCPELVQRIAKQLPKLEQKGW
ncbi:MAG: GTPase ObgE [Fibrobacter sp.]|nr:GTPase ObgE [Fibrobacter sp.]